MKSDYIILYIVFGQKRFFDEALFSIASVWHFIKSSEHQPQIVVYTDNDIPFKKIPVITEKLHATDWNKWAGSDNYKYRGKIICIQKCLEKYKLPTIFVDTDTYFLKSPNKLFKQLKAGNNILHFNEGKPSNVLLSHLEQSNIKEWLSSNIPHKVSGNIWNSGVIGLTGNTCETIKKVIKFNDLFFKATKYFATEQYAFSVVLDDENTIKQANSIVFHYWHDTLKSEFQKKINKITIEIGAYDIDKWSDVYLKYIPKWHIHRALNIRLRAYLFKIGLFSRFRSFSPMFFKNQK